MMIGLRQQWCIIIINNNMKKRKKEEEEEGHHEIGGGLFLSIKYYSKAAWQFYHIHSLNELNKGL